MIAAFDVHYSTNSCTAAAVVFSTYNDAESVAEYTQFMPVAADYIPSMLSKRELPCILYLLKLIDQTPDVMIVDAYVMLGGKPGLGQHLFEHFNGQIPVIGVAKSIFEGALAAKVFRGTSNQPLYVTATGIDLEEASQKIRLMHGAHRIPTLLKRVDSLSRARAKSILA